jgi:predicted RND superfamily exporter protein
MKYNFKPERMGRWIIHRKWLVISIMFLVALVAASGMRHLRINNDYHEFFSDENPQLKAYDALQQKYTKDDNVYIMLQPKNGNVFTKETLLAIENLVDRAWNTPYSSRVDAITNFQTVFANEDNLFIDALVKDASKLKPDDLLKIREQALGEPLLVNRLIDTTGSFTGVNITVKLPGESLTENNEVAKYVRKLVDDWKKDYPDINAYLTGNVIFIEAFDDNFAKDMSQLTPLMFLVIVVLLLIATRNGWATIGAFIVVLLSMFSGLGIAGWLGFKLSGPVFSAPNMIMTLAIADSVHVLITILHYLRKGYSKNEAIVETYRTNFAPILLTTVTTICGFLTLNFSDSPPFRVLGNITALGMAAAYFYSFFLLPALIAVLPLKAKKHVSSSKSSLVIERFSEFIIRFRKKILWVSSLVVFVMGIFIFRNELNNQFINFFDETVSFKKDSDFINDKLTGMYTIEFSLPSGSPDGISDPVYLKKVEEFAQWFSRQQHVVHVSSISDIQKRINKVMHNDQNAFYTLTASKEEAAQYLLLYEMSLPYGLDLNNQINVDKSETRFIATVKNISSKELITLAQSGENWLKKNAPGHMFSNGISMSLMFSYLTKRNMASMIEGEFWGLLAISIILVLTTRSLKYGLVGLLPNLAPVAVSFGVWGILVGQIDMGTSIVFGMVLGIIVDDTIHVLSKYLYARNKLGKSPEDAVRYSFATVAKAALVTTGVLTAGFLVLAQSHFGFNAGMAKMTAITLVIALVFEMTLLMPLLITIDKIKIKKLGLNLKAVRSPRESKIVDTVKI